MKINKNSWHYKLVNWGCNSVPDSMCAYFWSVVLCLSLLPLGCFLLLFVLILALQPILQFFFPSSFALVLGGGIIDVALLYALLSSIRQERRLKEGTAGQSSLLGEWIRAKKNKVCPKLEFIGE